MKQFERVQKEIQDVNIVNTGMSMTGFINGIEVAAIVWCKKNAPNELYVSGGATRVSIEGMAAYLDSEVEVC